MSVSLVRSVFLGRLQLWEFVGDLSNPLLVLPLQPASSSAIISADRNIVSDFPKSSNLLGNCTGPDKRRDDQNAHSDFQKLQTSYEVLKDEKTRKLFDYLLRVKWEKFQCQAQQNSKRQNIMSDLEIAALGICWDLSNPLLVLPLQPVSSSAIIGADRNSF
ncbi:unnamed protein product [Fraxinus pennsylvanica]|uniref:J domain-containing protein n=1 Tax=Fraxinus pennsylvanica TaxID=56036 RepID=A0AAD1ZS64_9LAMI|nr:unnamed protein product [Fraxinus pennsylvanica]